MKYNIAFIALMLAGSLIALPYKAQAAISLDRTRAIFPGTEKSIALGIANVSERQPYLAQAWLEDAQGNKITTPLSVTPGLQRVEPGKKSVVRVNALPDVASLPQDRESLFYFAVREVPPRSDRANVLQLALQSKIKLFYRPAAIESDPYARHDTRLLLHPVKGGYRIENPTPYYITVLGVSASKAQPVIDNFRSVMIAPLSSVTVRSATSSHPWVTTINDYGGSIGLGFICQSGRCEADSSGH